MSFVYKIAPSGDNVQVVGRGKVTTRECIGIVKRIMSDPRCLPSSKALVDLRNAIYKPDDLADVIYIAKAAEAFHSMLKNKIAIVASQSMLFTAELFSSHLRIATKVAVKVFVDIKAARAFLQQKSRPLPSGDARQPVPTI